MQKFWVSLGGLGWLAIVVLSLVPAQARPHSGADGAAEHFLAYCMVSACLCLGLSKKNRLPAGLLLVVSAGLLELLQRHIPGRSGDLEGLISAVAGVSAGAVVAWAVWRTKPQ